MGDQAIKNRRGWKFLGHLKVMICNSEVDDTEMAIGIRRLDVTMPRPSDDKPLPLKVL